MHLDPLAPVLARPAADGRPQLQIGIARPVVLTGLADDERAFIAELEGGREVTKAEVRRFAGAVGAVAAAGGWAAPDAEPGSVAVHGCGRLGMGIAEALARWGADVSLHDAAPSEVERPFTYAVDADGTCAAAAAATLSARGVTVRVGGGGEPLAVVVCEGSPDPWLVRQWMRCSVAHVLVACDDAGVAVSHVIVPGVTACSRCRDIALTRRDSAWPYLTLQLVRATEALRRPQAPSLAELVAAVATAARVAAWLGGEGPGEAVRVDRNGAVTAAPINPERECGCGAAGPVGDEVAARRAVLTAG